MAELGSEASMDSYGPWGTNDFELLGWHDVHVYGFKLIEISEIDGSTDLVLDIDYILKWDCASDRCQFTICPADLTFHHVFGLKMELDYATSGAGMCPFSISDIEREEVYFGAGAKSFRWHIPINWPHGSLRFDSPGFTLALAGKPVVHSQQSIPPELRVRNVAG
jgi:hypothetical protein